MRQETLELIRDVRKVVSTKIPVSWRSSEPMPGAGDRRSVRRGTSGLDFANLETYEEGDDANSIDWLATAQTGGEEIYVRKTFEPRHINVVVIADVGGTMDFGTVRVTKRVLTAELTCSILESSKRMHDRVGFISYSERGLNLRSVWPPQSVDQALIPALAAVLEPEMPIRQSTKSGLASALAMLPKTRCRVYVLSDFHSLKDEDRKALKKAAIRHSLVPFVIEDRRERELPLGYKLFGMEFGMYALQDMVTGDMKVIWLSAENRRLYAENYRARITQLTQFFRTIHADPALFSTEQGEAMFPRLLLELGSARR